MDEVSNITERHLERAAILGQRRAQARMRPQPPFTESRPRESVEEIFDDENPYSLWYAVMGDKFPANPTELDHWSLELLTDAFLDAYDEEYDNA